MLDAKEKDKIVKCAILSFFALAGNFIYVSIKPYREMSPIGSEGKVW